MQEFDVLEEVECFNDHQKVLGGLHESFLGVRFNDPTLCKVRAYNRIFVRFGVYFQIQSETQNN